MIGKERGMLQILILEVDSKQTASRAKSPRTDSEVTVQTLSWSAHVHILDFKLVSEVKQTPRVSKREGIASLFVHIHRVWLAQSSCKAHARLFRAHSVSCMKFGSVQLVRY